MLQALWFVSPVYFETKFFHEAGIGGFVDYNPIHHMLQLARAPLLAGEWPTLENYSYCLGTIVVLAGISYAVGRRYESKVIFYL